MTTPRRNPARCGHYQAVQTGATEANELPDGKWEYSQKYSCPTCGAQFVETNSGGSRSIVIVIPKK